MAGENTSNILDQLAGAYLAIEELNRTIPQLHKDSKAAVDATREAKKYCELAKRLLDEASEKGEKLKNDASVGIDKIATYIKRTEVIQTDIEKRISNLSDIDKLQKIIEELTERVNDIEKSYADRFVFIEEAIEQLKKGKNLIFENDEIDELPFASHSGGNKSNVVDEIDELPFAIPKEDNMLRVADENQIEYRSIQELFDNNDEYPLIVVSLGWSGDYCFVVDTIVNGFAYGVNYKNGYLQPKKYRRRREVANVSCYRIYDGPNADKIKAAVQNEDLAEFWTNRGFENRDERNQGMNKYLFVMGSNKELSPWVNAVKELFNVNGHFYGDHWGTISSK